MVTSHPTIRCEKTRNEDVGGEPGHTVRNHRFKDPVWEDISTLPELFEISCKNHSYRFSLGTRRLIAREVETSEDGKVFEKLHLIGHKSEERVAIFADMREEWFIALQGCFRRNVIVVTIYLSLERKLFVTRSMRYVDCVHGNPQTRNIELHRFLKLNHRLNFFVVMVKWLNCSPKQKYRSETELDGEISLKKTLSLMPGSEPAFKRAGDN
ncbi:hypothetical protein IGI04_041600 [Brassica rapa subsp. trilocularis]|uniref:Uncharacterized protein n=1 Tax=Brassica rapa subsp. trilocularis TaxID=1813537 RepID=A0ABQ7KRB1_BRACM|nr:hypothetical protein IGI04_041600 [Brassica rapa subsp. trilocularis]